MTIRISALFVSLVCACAGDFSPTVVGDESVSASDPTEDPGEDDAVPNDSSDDGSTSGSDNDSSSDGSSDDGSTSDGDSDDGSSGDTAEPIEHPSPGEPCDPFAAFDGTAPCDGDPEVPAVAYTCVPAQVGTIEDPSWAFRCVQVADVQGDGEELSDPCSDDGGAFFAGCMNSFCLSNGLSTSPSNDVYQNHPPIPDDDACPFIWWSTDDPNHEGDGYFVKACCTDFCDANHPCDAGWTCITAEGMVPASLDGEAVGACVWK